ncbi:hypothetical protein SAMN05216226_102131 [Halovenus aranensis]|uniref:Uncharacterized protein n=1 Tax=Halovenus aranensis TaxID=890420 RepID=A0A1G8SUB1_9EURY|nr:hypothetical protein [Halovenus aranensis]SDJ32355.1 hypothetical protein SAMN05216226_102131 [Halovenus aranensis]
MAKAVRITKEQLGNREVKVKLRDIRHPDYEKQVEFIYERSGDSPDETWAYGITEEKTAEFLRSSEINDLLEEPDPPAWVEEGLEMWDIRVQE